mmetsp:Transcript_3470/g.10506  ORF Transcript_3470/g.10506 Transcript_3470/m.10506 type:complete len:755 (-) Transcript_3470:1413-3677(-)|eukprot:CAMPEP_0198737978 /NCGR_PEP_ID=MMETSP1475-20131203/68142_1 /TAXON_ID= ORGANISM="Unidentified sp., Strain CCMP1999" /NCGR_SAMPLE_ID=MMETSP1475 /ASSEMBLY_ACC=CAM_ASM_001111 /LENGTH=754 /DNA_ID=CAMNT_0044501849 /DNA_START=229 /DNA_END=2493 /DNA_ORIENTATION=+
MSRGNVAVEIRLQREAIQAVSYKGASLTEAIRSRSIAKAVVSAADVAGELRTNAVTSLPARLYNDVFAAVGEELRVLESWIMREKRSEGAAAAFRRAQYSSQIVPRLYVAAATAGALCKLDPSCAREICGVLMDLFSGVQHPVRGLFLRSFMTQQLRRLSDELGAQESIHLLLRNLVEMTRLWVRVEVRRDAEDVRVLVGQTLSALGRLTLDLDTYATVVLPRLTETILACPASFAQEYLAECLIQVFPDEMHLNTLDTLLGMCQSLSRGVRMRIVISALTERLGMFVSTSAEGARLAADVEAFDSLSQHLPAIEDRMGEKLSIIDRLGMYLALLRYSLRAQHDRLDQVDKVLGFALRAVPVEGFERGSEPEKLIGYALTEPLIAHRSVAAALKLDNFRGLAARLSTQTRRMVAATMLKSVTDFPACLSKLKDLEHLFELVGSLVETDGGGDDDEEAQSLVARIVYLLDQSDPERLFQLYEVLRGRLAKGGVQKARTTFPSLVLACLRLAVRVGDDASFYWRVYEFAMETVGALAEADPCLALKLYLEGVLSAATSGRGAQPIVYDFFAHAIVLYEEQLDKRDRSSFDALMLIMGTLGNSAAALRLQDYRNLSNRLARHAIDLPDVMERCMCLCTIAKVVWSGTAAHEDRDGDDKLSVVRWLLQAQATAERVPEDAERAVVLVELLAAVHLLEDLGCRLHEISWIAQLPQTLGSLLSKSSSNESPMVVFTRQRFAKLDRSKTLNVYRETNGFDY